MTNCNALIAKDIAASCVDPIVGGLESNAVIINRDDVDFALVQFNATRNNVIENLPLKKGKRGYKAYVPGAKPFSGTKTSLEKGTYRNTFANDFALVILENDPDVTAQIIDGLANGKFLVVFENKHKNLNKATSPGDSSIQIFGYYQGLQSETIDNDKYSEETDGGWAILLKETKSPLSAIFLYKESMSATKALFDALTQIPANES